MIVAEIKPYSKCNHEDLGLLCKGLEKTSKVAYILTIGVVQQWRRHGIATIMLEKLIENLTINPLLEDCKAIYLHVLTTNTVAMRFYEKSNFRRHRFLPLYYMINTAACDGYCYVLYINGGLPPITIIGRISQLCCLLYTIFSFKSIKRILSNVIFSIYSRFVSNSSIQKGNNNNNNKGNLYDC